MEEAYDNIELNDWGKRYGMKVLEEDQDGKFIRRKGGNIHTLTNVINALPMMDTLRRRVLEVGLNCDES